MKKTVLIILILTLIVFSGFKKKEKPYVILSSGTITQESTVRVERYFSVGQRINYLLAAPDGVKYSGIRMQISKQDEKTSNWGFSVIKTEDIFIPVSDQSYRGYIVLLRPGHYIIQFFYLNNKRYPFIHKEFQVI